MMIRITTRLVDGAVLADIECADKNCLLDTVSRLAAENYGVDASVIQEGLHERERLGPTGFGGGTAIPHIARSMASMHLRVCFVRHGRSRLNMAAVDDEPVDLVFALFSPVQ